MITTDGLNLINELQESIHRSQELLIEPLSPDDRAVFMKLLAQLVDAHEKMGLRRSRACQITKPR